MSRTRKGPHNEHAYRTGPRIERCHAKRREVVVERVFNAPRHVVWQAFGFGMQKGRDQSYAALDRLLAEVAGTAAGQIGSTQHGGEDV